MEKQHFLKKFYLKMAAPPLRVNSSTSGLHLCAHGMAGLLYSAASSPTLPDHLALDSAEHGIHLPVRYVEVKKYFSKMHLFNNSSSVNKENRKHDDGLKINPLSVSIDFLCI